MADPVTVQLTLDIDDAYLSELGFEFSLTTPRAWGSRSKETTGLCYEPLTQTIMLAPKRDLSTYAAAAKTDWSFSDSSDNWEEVAGPPGFDYGSALFHETTSPTRVSATSVASWPYNAHTMVAMFLCYPNTANDYIDLSWGSGALRLRLQNGKHPIVTLNSKDWTIHSVPPVSVDHLYSRPLRLWVYFLREDIVVCSDFMPNFRWRPPRSAWASHTWNDGTYDHEYLAGSGTFKFEAPGMFFFNAVHMHFDTSGSGTFLVPFRLPYVPVQAPTKDKDWEPFPGSALVFSLRNQDDTAAYATGDQEGAAKFVMSTSNADYTPYVNSFIVNWPRDTGTKTGTNKTPDTLLVREFRSIDTGADTVELRIHDDGTYEDLQRVVNMRVNMQVNNVQRFVGYVDEPAVQWQGSQQYYTLYLRDVMRKLQGAILLADFRADGLTVSEAIEELIERAGVPSADIVADTTTVTLPETEEASEPAMLFPAGTNIYEAVTWLAEAWLPSWRLYARSDGKYVFEEWAAGSPEFTFLKATDAGVADEDRLLYDLEEINDDSGLRNFIVVVGLDSDGNAIRSVRYDSDSWLTPASSAYVGEVRVGVYVDTSLTTQNAVDTVSEALFNEVCRIRRYYAWRSKYRTDLLPGDVVTLEGEGNVKITDIDAQLEGRWGDADYWGEVI